MNAMFIFSVYFLVVMRIGRKKRNFLLTSALLKLAVHSDTSEVFYGSFYTERTRSGFLQVSLTKFACCT